MPHNRPSNRVDPVLFFFVRIRNKEHGLVGRGELEGVWAVDSVLGSFNGEAAVDVDDAARGGVLLRAWLRR